MKAMYVPIRIKNECIWMITNQSKSDEHDNIYLNHVRHKSMTSHFQNLNVLNPFFIEDYIINIVSKIYLDQYNLPVTSLSLP